MNDSRKIEPSYVSVAMATYNGERFIKEQIDSILCQTIKPSEIIICDDCSTDNTWEILQQYASKDSRFHVYTNNQNLGFIKNFEKAISLCSGAYVALSDQDDIWMDNHLEFLLDGMGNKIMSCGNALLVDENGKSLGLSYKEMELLDTLPDDDFQKLKSLLFFRSPYQGASMLFKRELTKSALPFPEGLSYHDRWLAMVACVSGGINYIDNIVLNYRRTHENVTEYKKNRSRIKYCLHGWMNGNVDDIDQLLRHPHVYMSEYQRKKLLKWRYILANNSKLRKPITISFLLRNYKTIYNC